MASPTNLNKKEKHQIPSPTNKMKDVVLISDAMKTIFLRVIRRTFIS
jgi:hypothetical protein